MQETNNNQDPLNRWFTEPLDIVFPFIGVNFDKTPTTCDEFVKSWYVKSSFAIIDQDDPDHFVDFEVNKHHYGVADPITAIDILSKQFNKLESINITTLDEVINIFKTYYNDRDKEIKDKEIKDKETRIDCRLHHLKICELNAAEKVLKLLNEIKEAINGNQQNR